MNEKMRVLIADDSKEFGKACQTKLKELGFDVVTAKKDGMMVVDYLGSQHFDAVLMDVFMAGLDGIGVLEYIKETLAQAPLTMIFSAIDSSEFEEQIIKAGADYYFIKPINPDAVAKRLQNIANWKGERSKRSGYTQARDIEVIISDIMREIGVPAHIKGYQYLRTAIELCIEDKTMLESVTKLLYPTVAKSFATTPSRVERAIRHAIEVAWDRGDVDVLNSYFGYTIQSDRGKPTNSEFIAMISDRLKLSLNQNNAG